VNTFTLKRGDTLPALRATLIDAVGSAVNITGATVRLHLNTPEPLDAAAIIDNASLGEVHYDWQTGDTDEAGLFRAEWQVTFSNGQIETFPNDTNDLVRIRPDLA
jgi:hypothetical protein